MELLKPGTAVPHNISEHQASASSFSIKSTNLLPPANEVWGKVIFSEACVKNSVHGGECLTRYTPTPPGPGRYPPQTRQVHPPGTRQVPPWTRQAPPWTRQVPPWDQAGTPPLGPGRYIPPGPGRHPPRPGRYTPPGPGRYTPLGTGRYTPRDQAGTPPRDQVGTPPGPGRYTPLDQAGTPHPPPGLGRYSPPRYGQRAGGTHPTGMQSCTIKVKVTNKKCDISYQFLFTCRYLHFIEACLKGHGHFKVNVSFYCQGHTMVIYLPIRL